MARISQSASSCGLASWMRPHVVPDTHSLKLLFITRYNNRAANQPLHIQLNTYRAMVAAENLIVNLRTPQLIRNPI